MNEIKVASWNVNSVRARIDLILKWIKTNNPDILLLQEIKAREEDFPYSAFENLNYNIGHLRPTLVYGENDPHNGYGPNMFLRLAKNARKKFGYGTRKVPKIKL